MISCESQITIHTGREMFRVSVRNKVIKENVTLFFVYELYINV